MKLPRMSLRAPKGRRNLSKGIASSLTLLAMTTALFVWPTQVHAAELLDKIVAVINDDVLTQSELDRNLAPIFQEYRGRFQGEEFIEMMGKARTQILNQMIEDKIVLQTAKAKKIPVTEVEIQQKINEMKKRFRAEGDFERYLDSQGITLTKLRTRYQEMILIQKIQSVEVRSRVVVSPLEAKRFYDEHMEEFTSPEAYHIYAITIRKKTTEGADKEDLLQLPEKMEQLRRKILKGEISFGEAAKQSSEDTHADEGGDMGFLSKGEFIPQLEDAIFKLQPGDMTAVLESEIGYHLFKLDERRDQKIRPFEEVKDNIEGLLYSEKSKKRFDEWMAQLRKDAYISIR